MGIEDVADMMTQIEISGVWPNPATDFVKVEFVSDGGGKLSLSVYNPLGQRVYYTDPKEYGVGRFEMEIDLRDMRKGNYVVQLNASKKSVSRLLVVK
jgi:hypothetical protein